MDVMTLPLVNACLNGTSAVLIFLGWRAIKAGKRDVHQKFMITALCTSTLFLCSYVTYHILRHGLVTHYTKTGISRGIYFFILGTHTPLAIVIVPFAIAAVYHAVKGNFTKHTRITKWLLPTWMYVSVTGVLIYVMLYVL